VPDPALIQALKDLGFGGMAVFALVGGFRGWYVWRREHDAVKVDRDYWRDVALESMGHTDKALEVAAKGPRRA
jgi:hypothetical protein